VATSTRMALKVAAIGSGALTLVWWFLAGGYDLSVPSMLLDLVLYFAFFFALIGSSMLIGVRLRAAVAHWRRQPVRSSPPA
jgi:hypothetical protein